jgi:hypothetical protein
MNGFMPLLPLYAFAEWVAKTFILLLLLLLLLLQVLIDYFRVV